ncbi:hypothetical protein FIBSPDRAFT_866495 [Athelia psychrophila]|uniref:Uncharacterized protein n=1 Tax=Athelia psychrophila TaxID=1759441 RepID=A0A166EQF5_9AGAM|nr:hypothetical protein FIBSPDRAFT_866495 [Fibularhizoctonia sp. CBS 109695]
MLIFTPIVPMHPMPILPIPMLPPAMKRVSAPAVYDRGPVRGSSSDIDDVDAP